MNKHVAHKKNRWHALHMPVLVRLLVLASIVAIGSVGIAQQIKVNAAQTPDDYCAQFSGDTKQNACQDGIRGATCSDYAVMFDQATADVCTQASKAVANGLVSTTATASTSPSPSSTDSISPSPSPSSSSSTAIGDLLDQSGTLSQLINALHLSGSDASVDTSKTPDNNYGSYTNGAGKQQPIKVYPSGVANGPALVWFNGGGWHADDGTSYCIATGSSKKNCAPSTDGGGDTGPSDQGPPPGGGAVARGYTVIEVTYRLGSDGVYYMYEDVLRGLQHVINNAKLYNIDPTKIAVGGDSAGGSLAMRVVASGKSGAKVGVGWSAPTNAFTALFKSFQSFLIGLDHSTCIPTDLAGAANTTDLLNGGSGNVATEGLGLSSNDFSSLGIGGGGSSGGGISDPISVITQVMTAAQYAADTGQNLESISKSLEDTVTGVKNGGGLNSILSSKMASGVFNLSAKKLGECLDNIKVLSPALFASPNTPPVFMVEFDDDDLVDPQQAYDMRDEVRGLGGKADALILPGDPTVTHGLIDVTTNHMGYDPRALCPTLNFIGSVIGEPSVDCGKAGAVASRASGSASSGGSCVSQVKIQHVPTAELTAATTTDTGGDSGYTFIPDIGVVDTTGLNDGSGDSSGGINQEQTTPGSSDYLNSDEQIQHLNNNQTDDNAATENSGGGSGSGGGGGCSGSGGNTGGATNAGGSSTGGTTNSSGATNTSGTSNALGGLGDPSSLLSSLGSLASLGNLSSLGGLTGNSSSTSTTSGSTTTTTGTANTTGGSSTNNGGNIGDATGARGGGVFNNSTGGIGSTSDVCEIDYSRAPDLASAAKTMLSDCNNALPQIESYLNATIHSHPVQIMVVPNSYSDTYDNSGECGTAISQAGSQSGSGTLAFAVSGAGRLYICADEYRKDAKNYIDDGIVVHESTHLTQNYAAAGYNSSVQYSAPFWVQEGIPDFMRAKLGYTYTTKATGVKDSGLHCYSDTTYVNGYNCAAAFLTYLVRVYNSNVVKNIQKAANAGNYTDSVVTAGTGKSLDTLYTECLQHECKGGASL